MVEEGEAVRWALMICFVAEIIYFAGMSLVITAMSCLLVSVVIKQFSIF